MKPILLFLAALQVFYCSNPNANHSLSSKIVSDSAQRNLQFTGDILPPQGYERVNADKNSFAAYLRTIHLKHSNTVYLFNGRPKANQTAQFAVLDIPVGNKDLQQCADAVMRLRSEFLFQQNRFNEIVFYDNNHTAYSFTPPYSRDHFEKYLLGVFAACGTASLSKQLNKVDDFNAIQPGDVLIKGGSPGHAVIVMDVAVNNRGEKAYLLAQSYMPAQDIHILKNPLYSSPQPWYKITGNEIVPTPEWTFTKNELKRWNE